MENMDKIRDYIAKGETEKAIKQLVDYTKETSSPFHDEAVLLSGQFRQWKRQTNLGIDQSKSDLRRIEMGILNILQDKTAAAQLESGTRKTASVSASVNASKSSPQPEPPKKSNFMPLIIGAMILALGGFGYLFFTDEGGDGPVIDGPVTETPIKPKPKPIPKPQPTPTPAPQPVPKPIPKPKPVPKPLPKVNGKNVNYVAWSSGALRNMGNGRWIEEGKNGKERFTFQEVNRGDFSVFLLDKARNIQLRPDLHTKYIMYKEGNNAERKQYKITTAYDVVKGDLVKKVIYDFGSSESSFARVPGTKTWLEDNPDSRKRGTPKKLTETGRDEWSVYLNDGTFDVALDLYQKKVKLREKGKDYRPIYTIKKAY